MAAETPLQIRITECLGRSCDDRMMRKNSKCWICGSHKLALVKPPNCSATLNSNSFSITDSHYGVTAGIYECGSCGFLQCSELAHVLPFYEGLVDADYEAGRRERTLQAHKILRLVRKLRPGGRLLDIGAGSGMLVEQAMQMGYAAEGIEPSRWLYEMAVRRRLPVHLGVFPNSALGGRFDVITLIDVIEHVSNPVELLRHIAEALDGGGVAVIVTPDVRSLAARILGWKWWHFRVAHICYFSRRTLMLALDRAGLRPILVRRSAWFFTADYLWVRTHRYLPKVLRFPPPRFLARMVVPVNLRDSWLVACTQKNQSLKVSGAR
jgi:SAM-dependent methyltransferase